MIFVTFFIWFAQIIAKKYENVLIFCKYEIIYLGLWVFENCLLNYYFKWKNSSFVDLKLMLLIYIDIDVTNVWFPLFLKNLQ